MKRYSTVFLLALIALVLNSCSERDASLVDVGRGTSLAFAPRFVYLGSSQQAFAPVNAIRLTARSVPSNAIVATVDTTVNPADTEWDLRMSVPPDAGTVIVLIELLNRTNGIETSEWSGLTAPIEVTPGSTHSPAVVQLFQGPPANLQVTSVAITPDGFTLSEGTSRALGATVLPAGVAFWSSLDPTVATVDASGNVLALRNGTARIVAAAGPRADTVAITATAVIANVTVSPDTIRLAALGADAIFTGTGRDARGATVTDAAFNWTVDNAAIASNTGNGRFRALANGTTQVRATSAANPALSDAAVLIVAQRAGRLAIAPPNASIAAIGGTQQFTATPSDANGNAMPATPIAWRSANPAIATVNGTGLATAVTAGSTEIIAVVNAGSPDSVVARASLLVSQTISTIAILPGDTTLGAFGQTAQLRAEARDANGNVMQNVTFTWTSANAAIASVDATGLVTALNNGASTIIAAAGTARGTANVTVAQVVTAVTVTPARDSIPVAGAIQLNAVARDAGNSVVQGAAFTWTSSDPNVATVNNTGLVTGRAAGTVTITAQSGTATGTALVKVVGGGLPNLTALSLTTDPVNPLIEGQTITVTLRIRNTGAGASAATQVQLAILNGAPPHAPLGDTLIVLPALQPGDSVTLTESYTLDELADFPDSVVFAAVVDPANVVAESVETDNLVQTAAKVIQFVQHVWTGAVSTDWHNPLNWSPLDVPHARSPVLIPAAPVNQPIINQHADILSLTQEATSDLQIFSGAVLTVRGNVTGAIIEGAGLLRLASTAYTPVAGNVVARTKASANAAASEMIPTVNGRVEGLIVEHAVALNGQFKTAEPATITATGIVYVASEEFRVQSSLHVDGILDMTNPEGSVVVYAGLTFTGGTSSVGHLTAGTLIVLGDFTASAANAFAASDTHVTLFGGEFARTVTMSPYPGVHFQTVRTDGSDALTFVGDAVVNGTFELKPSAGSVHGAGTITIGENLVDVEGGRWLVNNTVFTGSPSFPMNMLHNVMFKGDAQLTGVNQLYTIGGNVVVSDGGNLDLNGADLTVGGTLYTQSGGTIEMRQFEELNVMGDASFDGGSTYGKLQSGRINVHGNFSAGAPAAYAACRDCGEGGLDLWMVGTARTTISMQNSSMLPTGNHFGDLYIANSGGVALLSDIAVDGDLEFGTSEQTPLVDEGAGYTVTLADDLDDEYFGRNFQVSNLILLASGASLPNLDPETGRVELHTNLTFAGTGAHELGDPMHVYGNVTVRNGELNLDQEDLLLDGDFLTIEGGSLRMPSCDCSGARLRVMGNATFSGGNNTDDEKLASGTIYVGGNFTAAENSFNASQYHVTKMYDYAENGEERTITLTNPGLGEGQQHFGTLRIRRPTRLETDIAVVGHIELDGGEPLIGVGKTAIVAGDIEEPSVGCEFCCTECAGQVVATAQAGADEDTKPLAYGARRSATAPRGPARTSVPALKPSGLRRAPALRGRPAANTTTTFEGLYRVENTVLAGGFQSLPEFMETNLRVVSEVTLYSPYDYEATLILHGNLVVDGAGTTAELRLTDLSESNSGVANVQVTGNFETRNGGTLLMASAPCECSAALFVTGDLTFDGGSLAGKLTGGNIIAGGNFTSTLANPLSFVSDGTEFYFSSLSPTEESTTQTLTIANPDAQTFASVVIGSEYGGLFVIPNGMTVRGYFQATGPVAAPLNISGGSRLHLRQRPDAYNAFYLSHVRFDGIRFEADRVQGVAYSTVFGTYPADVDQMTLRGNDVTEEASITVYMDGLTFLSPADASHYHLRATGDVQVDIINVSPATAGAEPFGARWIAENGAQVVWGDAPNIGIGSLSLDGPLFYNDILSINTYGYLNNGNLPTLPEFTVRMQVFDAVTNTPIETIPEQSVTATSANWDNLTDVYIPIADDLWEAHPEIKVRWIIDVTNTVDETNEADNEFFTPTLNIEPPVTNRVAERATRRVVPAPQPRARPVHPKALQ